MSVLQALAQIISGLVVLLKMLQEHRNEKWAKDTTELFSRLSQLKGEEERREAAKKLNDLFRSL